MDCGTGLQWLEYYINVEDFDNAYKAAIWAINQPIKIHIEETSSVEIQRTNSQELNNEPTRSQQSKVNPGIPQQVINQPGMIPQQNMGRFQPNPGMIPGQFMNQPGMIPQQTINPRMTPRQFMNQPGMMPRQPINQPGMMPQQPIMNPGMMPKQTMNPGMNIQQTINQRTTSISTAASTQDLNKMIYDELIERYYEPTQAVIGATGTTTIEEAEEKIRKFMSTIR